MRTFALLVLIFSADLVFGDDPEAKPPDPAEIARLIKQLDADDFRDREAAGVALLKMGQGAKEAVQKAVKESESAEVRTRGEQLLKQFRIQELQRNALKLDIVYQMARDISAGKAKAEELEPLLDRMLEVIAAADSAATKPMPVRISACKPPDPGAEAPVGAVQTLYVGQPSHDLVQNSTVIFEAGGRIHKAQNSIIIAWGMVDMLTATNCIVIAGCDVSITSARNCLVLAGGELTLSTGTASTLGAGESATVNMLSQRCFMANTKPPENMRVPGRAEVVELKVPGLVLREKAVMEETLSQKLSPTFMSNEFMVFTISGQPGEFIARPGRELLDPFGKPIAGLEGWKLELATSRFATFANDNQRTFVRFKKP